MGLAAEGSLIPPGTITAAFALAARPFLDCTSSVEAPCVEIFGGDVFCTLGLAYFDCKPCTVQGRAIQLRLEIACAVAESADFALIGRRLGGTPNSEVLGGGTFG